MMEFGIKIINEERKVFSDFKIYVNDKVVYEAIDRLVVYNNKVFLGDINSLHEKYNVSDGSLNNIIMGLKNNEPFKVYFGASNGEHYVELSNNEIIFNYEHYIDEDQNISNIFRITNNYDNRTKLTRVYQILLDYIKYMLESRKLTFFVNSYSNNDKEIEVNLDFTFLQLNAMDLDNMKQFSEFIENKDDEFHSLCFVNGLDGHFSISITKDNYNIYVNSSQQNETFTKKRNDESDKYMIEKLNWIKETFYFNNF